MTDMVNISVANAGITAVLGYLVVFVGLILLMLVVMLMGKIMVAQNKKAAAKAAAGTMPTARTPARVALTAFFPLRESLQAVIFPPIGMWILRWE